MGRILTLDKVYYLPSKETKKILEELVKDPQLEGVSYQPVQRDQIKDISDKVAVLLWGSGFEHDVSHLFSPRGYFCKEAYDAHEDNWDEDKLSRYTHLRFTAKLENCARVTLLQPPIDTRGDRIPEEYMGIFISHSNITNTSGKRVHLSADLDCIRGFPAYSGFQAVSGFFTLEEVRLGIKDQIDKNNVIRFDIGGLYLPTKKDLYKYGPSIANPQNKEILDYAVNCYRVLLKEFLIR